MNRLVYMRVHAAVLLASVMGCATAPPPAQTPATSSNPPPARSQGERKERLAPLVAPPVAAPAQPSPAQTFWQSRDDLLDLPPAPAPAVWAWPEEQSFNLQNGLVTRVVKRRDEAMATVALVLPAGEAAENESTRGASALLAGWLRAGTSRRDGLPLELRVEQLGANLTIDRDRHDLVITCTSVQPVMAGCVRLVADVALAPAFDEQTLLPVRAQVAAQVREALSSKQGKAGAHLLDALVGDDHPLGRAVVPEDVGAREASAVRAFWAAWFKPNLARLVIVGDVATPEVKKAVEQAFAGWPRGGAAARTVPLKPRPQQGLRILLVDEPNAPDVTVSFGQRVRVQSPQQRAALEAAVFIFGGAGLGSRLALDVATQGLIAAGGATLEPLGPREVLLRGTLQSLPQKAWPALLAAAQQLKNIKDQGLSPAELAEAKARSAALDPFGLQSGAGLAEAIARSEGKSLRPLVALAQHVNKLDARAILAAARGLSPETMAVVMVGPAHRIAPSLQNAKVRFETIAFDDPISVKERQRLAQVQASSPQDQNAARALIIRGLAAQGGAPAFRALRTLKVIKEGQRRERGVITNVVSTTIYERPDKVRVEQQARINGQVARGVFVVSPNGVRGGDGAGPLQPLPPANVERLRAAVFEDVTFLLLNILDASPRLPMQMAPPLAEEGRSFEGVMVKVPSGQWLTLYFDAETRLLARLQSADGAGGTSEQRLSDYREVEGLRLAWRQVSIGENASEATIKEVHVNPPLDPAMFK